MVAVEKKEEAAVEISSRRSFIALFFKLILFSGFTAPLVSFLRFHVKSPPRLVTVTKILRSGGFIIEPEFIIFDTGSGPRAVSRRCTHLGCRLNYNEESRQLICPCHHSRFDRAGHRIAGPARRDLDIYSVREQGGDRGFVVSI